MKCPHCQSIIPDGSAVCPACRMILDATASMPKLNQRYCKACGALARADAKFCTRCGMPLDPTVLASSIQEKDEKESRQIQPGSTGELSQDTHVMPRIASAFPDEDLPLEQLPRMRMVVLSATATLLVVCAIAIALLHPWDPNAYSQRATQDADMSQAGFPGKLDRLSGQDRTKNAAQTLSANEYVYEQLSNAYKKLEEMSKRADELTRDLQDKGLSADLSSRQASYQKAKQLALDVSNLISEVQKLEVDDQAYTQSKKNMVTLGSWLRNRVDILNLSWKRSAESSDLNQDKSKILEGISGGSSSTADTYARLFEESFAKWKPEAPASK